MVRFKVEDWKIAQLTDAISKAPVAECKLFSKNGVAWYNSDGTVVNLESLERYFEKHIEGSIWVEAPNNVLHIRATMRHMDSHVLRAVKHAVRKEA